MKTIPVAVLHELFVLTYAREGVEAGSLAATGYRKVMIQGQTYLAHRIVYAMATGEWPKSNIDHINGKRDDNRPANLRDVTQAENMQNRLSACRNSTSGFIGVTPGRNGRWKSAIRTNGGHLHLGTFDRAEDAHAAYLDAKRLYHPASVVDRD